MELLDFVEYKSNHKERKVDFMKQDDKIDYKKNASTNQKSKVDKETLESQKKENTITDERVKNFIPSAVAPDNNRIYDGPINPLCSKGN